MDNLDLFYKRSADFSPCRTYRYCLRRHWDDRRPAAMFVGLNRSVADETGDDPTIRRCIGFAQSWGYGGIIMANLFAFVTPSPEEMMKAADPVGPDNDAWLVRLAGEAGIIVAAWGAQKGIDDRVAHVTKVLIKQDFYCLGRTEGGHPRHPLFVLASIRPVFYFVD